MLKKLNNAIGIFDSGLGGLNVIESIQKQLPNYNYIYLGDTARLPYGTKSQENIFLYTQQAIDFLFQQGCQLIIIACNTASSQALQKIQEEYLPKQYPHKKVLGVIRPLIENVSSLDGPIGIIGTKATINSQTYLKEINKINPSLKVYQQSAPLLVPLIEEGWTNKPETRMILKKYLRPLKTKRIKSLILACTHYPFLYKDISRIMGKNVVIPHPGEIIANSLKIYLNKHSELNIKETKNHHSLFYVTDDPNDFREKAKQLLHKKISKVEKVDIIKL